VKPIYKIGTTFVRKGARKVLETVVDILTTTNSSGEVVKIRYVADHEYMGQIVRDSDVLQTTISMGQLSYTG